jgi:hypothetical protein
MRKPLLLATASVMDGTVQSNRKVKAPGILKPISEPGYFVAS